MQVSLYSSNPEDHEKVTLIKGSYDRTINGIKTLVEHGVPVTISTIITNNNIGELENIINLAIKLNVNSIMFGNFSRYGRGRILDNSWEITKENEIRAEDILNTLRNKYNQQINIERYEDEKKDIPFDRIHNGFSCGAGNREWVIDENGNIKPCVFLPVGRFSSGNLFNDNFEDLIKKNHIRYLYKNIKEWEMELLKVSRSIEQICPVMKQYEQFFDEKLWQKI